MKSLKKNNRKEIPKISLWGIDDIKNFNAIHYHQWVPENLPQYSPHKKTHFVASFIVRGKLKSYIDFREYGMAPGFSALVNPNQIHWIEVKRPQIVEAYVLAFNKKFLDKLDIRPGVKITIHAAEEHIKIAPGEHAEILRKLFQSIIEEFQRDGERANFIVCKLMEALLTKFDQIHPSKKSSFKKSAPLYLQFLNALDESISENHRVSYYAKLLGTSEKSLNRACQEVAGETVQQVIHHKINYEAKRLLHFSKTSAKEIAYKTGFRDPVQFSKFFKHHNSRTPMEYRRQLFSQKKYMS